MKDRDNLESSVDRREFVKLCMGAVALGTHGAAFSAADATARTYRRSLLVGPGGSPLRIAELVPGENYIFHYPYVTTPCFLLDLGEAVTREARLQTESGTTYTWRGGVGPSTSVVAFSAICAHKMTHPAKSVSFINYRHERVRFQDGKRRQQEGSHVIYCCSERSIYDARQGARVLGGPAKQPLAAIQLEYEAARDQLFAVGTYGGEMFNKFFAKFTSRLQLEYQTSDVTRFVAAETEVVPLDEYCATQVLC